ncbi:MAG: lytic transglycosylase domain-containing protein [Saprospiraceae bacterium]
MKKLSIFSVSLAAILTFAFFSSYKGPDEKQNEQEESIQSNRYGTIRPVELPASMSFAGEPLPLDNFDVMERLDREMIINVYWPSTALANMKRAGRYFPMIESILAEHGVPQDFKYLAIAESGLKNATSSAGAKGIWQFMSKTAKYYGMVIDAEVDERYNIEKATESACKYLKGAHKKFGSWTLAAASYNMGEPRLQRMLKEQHVSSYYDVHLSEETLRYVFRIIAIKEIYSNKEKYGFDLRQEDLYKPFDNYSILQVNTPIASLADFAQKYGTTYRKLKLYNPWLKKPYLRNKSRRTYKIKIPKQD